MSTAAKIEGSLVAKRALLASRLRQEIETPRPLPLSFAQQRLWFLDQLEPNSPLYNIVSRVSLQGCLDLAALERSLNSVLERHEALRTRFVSGEETPAQVVERQARIEMGLIDLTNRTAAQREAEAARLIEQETNRPFQLDSDRLIRATLLRHGPQEHELILVLHHIVADEWSLKVLFQELGIFYKSFITREPALVPALPIQYADYALWQRDRLQGKVLEEHLSYWRRQLANSPLMTPLPTDRPRGIPRSLRGATATRVFCPELVASLDALAKERGATLFMVLLAGFKALLQRYTQQEDVVVGSPVAGRTRLETESLIGFFVNTLPLRTSLAGDPTFADLLARVRETTIGAYANQELPFEKIVEELHPERSLSHIPFTNIMFVLQNDPLEQLAWPGLELRFLEVASSLAKFELTVMVRAGSRGTAIMIEYNRDLFDPPTIERLLGHYENLLQGIVRDPLQRISGLPLLTEAERQQVLVQWNDTKTTYPRDLCVHQVFEQQVARTPQATALVFGENSISYRDLNTRANQLAHYLRHLNVSVGQPVCLCLQPSIELIIGMLAVLKAGGAYVPLDPGYPQDRLAFMVRDSQAPVLLTQLQLLPVLPSLSATTVCLDKEWERITQESCEDLATTSHAQSEAYVMYTSGSTGQPKGVVVPHRAINRLVLSTNYIQFVPRDRIAQVSNVAFDAATFEIWGALLNGATLVGMEREVVLTPKLLAHELAQQRITVMFLTAALFNQMAAEAPDAFRRFRTLMVGGEALDPKWVRTVLQHGPPERLLNGYGPTENTTFTCWHLIREVAQDASQIPIGRPISNTQVYVLDPNLNPVPVGVAGELYAGGDGLALGYWQRPQLNAEKFVQHAFFPDEPPRVLYRTGDLARFLPTGEIEFMGRRDDQVKIRGFRIELGEIESVLASHPDVKQCVVSVYRNTRNEKGIVAYLAMNPGSVLEASQVRAYLAEKLPEYMLPAAFIPVSSLPLTANGKVDRRSLPTVQEERSAGENSLLAPRDSTERELARIWEKILEVRPIGVKDRFFDLGGHSLLAVKVVAQIEKAFGTKLRLATIFQAPTIEQLAKILRGEVTEGSLAGASSLVGIQSRGSRPPLFLVHGAGGGMFWGYMNLAHHLGADQPVYGFKAAGLEAAQESERIEDLAAHYIADLQAAQPQGPYYLGGYCFGGTVAYEMARQLTAKGQEVALLALLNCSPPNSRYLHIPWTLSWAWRFVRNLRYLASYFLQWTPQQRHEFFHWKWALLKKRLKRLGRSRAETPLKVEAGDLVDLSSFSSDQRRTWESHIRALLDYHPKPYDGPVHLFRSPGHPLWCSFDPDYGWGNLARGPVRVTVVPGAHEKILQDPCVASLARELANTLREAQGSAALPGQPTEVHKVTAKAATHISSEKNGVPSESMVSLPRPPAHNISVLKGPKQDFSLEATFPCRFLERVGQNPAAIAVRYQGQELTYAELNTRANQLAHFLQGLGVGPEVLVGICMDRSLELAIALLAVLKAGGAYLPLDPAYPLDRLAYMLEDSKTTLLLTRGQFLPTLSANQTSILDLSEPDRAAEVRTHPVTEPPTSAGPDNLAYVIYTSGSTGNPKGVQITHRSMLNHNFGIADAFQLKPSDRILQFTPLSFDISVEEIFPSWLSGSTVVLRGEELVSSAESFFEFISLERVTVLNLPTAFWHELVSVLKNRKATLPPCVRLVVIGGEKPSEAAYKVWKEKVPPSVDLINGYGTTEATVTTTLYRAQSAEDSLPIGRPLANTEVVLLDEHLRPVAPGNEGQLYIGGLGVARGYLNRPELTANRFIGNPSPDLIESARLYKTGDLARLRPDGNLEFIGRADELVKIRGFRIELGEIEAALQKNPGVQEAVVVAREDVPGRKRLVAYYVPRSSPGPRSNELSTELRKRLPDYMVPALFVSLPNLPLSAAGKVDRRGLPVPGQNRPELEQQLVAPRLPLEKALSAIWAEVLELNSIGVHDNFFDLGGDSLLATQVISRVRDLLNMDLTWGQFFGNPTVARLSGFLSEASGPRLPQLPLSALGSAVRVPLSLNQRHIWLLEQFFVQRAPFNLPVGIRLQGELNPKALEQSLSALALRHEALRAVFPSDGGEPTQYLCEPRDVVIKTLDLSTLPAEQREQQASRRVAEESGRHHITFHPVLRPVLIRLSRTEHWLVLILHEIAVDGRSVRLLLEELASLYQSSAGENPTALRALPVRYTEATIQVETLAGADEQRQTEYWLNQLRDAPARLDLPLDHSRPARLSGVGARRPVSIPAEVIERVERLGRNQDCDLFTILLAGFATVLHRYSNAEDIVIGSLQRESPPSTLAHVVANLENPVALRCNLGGDPTFVELLHRLRAVAEGALAHSSLSFAKLVDQLPTERNGTVARVFRVMLLLGTEPIHEYSAGGVRFVPFQVENETAKLDLSLHLVKAGGGLSGWIEYSTQLFDAERMDRLGQHLTSLLAGAAAAPATPISQMPLMSDVEKNQVLVEWNRTEQEYPKSKTLVDLFLDQVARTPDSEALVYGTERFTYRQLEAGARRIARQLRQLGVGNEDLVGIFMERSAEMIAGMLGTLLAGAAYVPLDPAYPQERLNAIARDAKLRILLSREQFRSKLDCGAAHFLHVERLGPQPETDPEDDSPAAKPSNLAYVIYTSGSTGKPKGVSLEHRNAVAFAHWARSLFSAEELAGVLASTSICFDLSVFEIFVPLSWGGKIVLAENALALPSLPAAAEVTLINTVPSAIRELLRAKAVPASTCVVNLAGEPLSPALVDQIYHETSVKKVYDLYGPTETTTYSTGALRVPGAPATIGRPLANEQVYLLDSHLQPVPIGVPGELYIGGAGVARGYLNRPELTAEKFVPHPLKPHERLYRTGDLARWTSGGTLEFLGRIDHQVKIRGFRIELGEIEFALKALDSVREAVVLAREDQPGDKRLVAYVVGTPGSPPTIEGLRLGLTARLPAYMVPSAFVLLENLPLTPNGKVDRKNLPAPSKEPQRSTDSIVRPRNAVEKQLGRIWSEVLHVEDPGMNDNFFDAGGHSLLAAQVVARIREQFKVEMPLFALFSFPTIAALAEGLAAGQWSRERTPGLPLAPIPRAGQYCVSFVQERLWFLDQLVPGGHAYNVPAAMRVKGKLDISALQEAVQAVVDRHEALRTVFQYTAGQLTQTILGRLENVFSVHELGNESELNRETECRGWLKAQAQRPFDLTQGPLIRAALLRLSLTEHLFVVVMHHTICDGWSLSIFFQELEKYYSALVAGRPRPRLPDLPVQYVDFAHWQRHSLEGQVLERELSYWKTTLEGAPSTVALPTDHRGSEEPPTSAARRSIRLEPALYQEMSELAQRQSATPFMFFMAALVLTLHKWTRQTDLVVGTVVAGRNRSQLEQVIGCFMNFLPVRTRVTDARTGQDILTRVKNAVLEGQSHQDCPFEKIVEAVNPERRLNQNPLYNVGLLLQNFPAEPFHSETLEVNEEVIEMDAALLDLRFEAQQQRQGFSFSCEYRTDLFEPATIEELLGSVLGVLSQLVREPVTQVEDFQLTPALEAQSRAASSQGERQHIAVAATFTAEPLAEPLNYWMKQLDTPAIVEFAPYNQVFQQLLEPESILARNPRGLNLILLRLRDWRSAAGPGQTAGNDADHKIQQTLREFVRALQAAATRTAAHWLVCLCPSSKAVENEPQWQEFHERMEQELARELDSIPGVHCLTTTQQAEWYPVPNYHDPTAEELGHVPYTPVFFTALATAVARKLHALNRIGHKVIVLDCDQTLWSGVCGEDGPGGVCLDSPRQALQEFMRAQHKSGMLLCLNSKNHPDDVRAVFAQRSDLPLQWEHFAGCQLNWRPKSENLRKLAADLQLSQDSFIFVDDNPVECAEVEANCPEVLTLLLPEDPSLIPQFLNQCWAFDHLKVTSEDRKRAELYRQNRQREEVRSQSLSLVEFLEKLELVIQIEPLATAHLARVAQLSQRTNQFNCNLKRFTETELQTELASAEALTVQVRDRFGDYGLVGAMLFRSSKRTLVVDSFFLSCRALGRGVEHRMLARTGEIARERGADWVDVHFVNTSRNKPALDFLNAVGASFKQALNGGYVFRFPAGFAAEVAFHPTSAVETAAPMGSPQRAPEAHKRQAPATKKFAAHREIALRTLDLAKLQQEIEKENRVQPGNHVEYVAPRTQVERQLCQVWQQILRTERVGVRDNFFELGGHSLLAVRLFSEIERVLGRKLPLVTLFQAPTIEQLAPLLQQEKADSAPSLLVPIQPRGDKTPLFLVHGAGGDILWGYANLAAHLPGDQPVYGIKSRGQAGLEEFSSLKDMAAGYVEAVRTLQSRGPYLLGGYCFGGNVAYEMARQLHAQGESVGLVALLDSAPSNAGYEKVPWWRPDFAWKFSRNFYEWLKDFAALTEADRRAFVARKVRYLFRKWKRRLVRPNGAAVVDLEEVIDPRHFPENELKLWQIHLQELVEHVEEPYAGEVTLLRTHGQPLFCALEPDFCWGKLARGGVRVKLVPGSHENVFVEPHVRTLARELNAALATAHEQSGADKPAGAHAQDPRPEMTNS